MHSVGYGFFDVWMENYHQPVRIAWISRSKVSKQQSGLQMPVLRSACLGDFR